MKMILTKRTAIILLIGIFMLSTLSVSVYFFIQYRRTAALLKNPTETTKEENKSLVIAVGKIVEIPPNEEPTIATVSDKDKLKDQPFFVNAQNGDKVLFFQSVKKAILYRPGTGKVIEISSVNISSAGATEKNQVAGASTAITPSVKPSVVTPSPTVSIGSVRIAAYNGTTTPKLANDVEKFLTEKYPLATVVKKDNAQKTDYEKTLIIDLSGNKSEEASYIAQLINATVVLSLPTGEIRSDADIIIIIGKNYQPK